MYIQQFHLIYVSVDLSGGQAGVAEQFLHTAQIRSGVQEMRGKGVPELVGSAILRQSSYL